MEWFTGGREADPRRLVQQLGDPLKRDQAAQALVRLGSQAAPALIEALEADDEPRLGLVQQVLARIGSPAVPQLTEALRAGQPLDRRRVAEVLGSIGDRQALPDLAAALRDPFYSVRAQAALSLGQLRDTRAIPVLITALLDAEPAVRAAAATALGAYPEPKSLEALGNVLLDDSQIEVRQAAVRAIGAVQRPEVIPFLVAALHDSFWWYERDEAINDLLQAMAQMGPAVVPSLIEALTDNEGTVRKLAATLLGRLRDTRALEPLGAALYDTHPDVSKAAAEALGAMGSPAMASLLAGLHHPEEWIRQQAVIGLALTGDPQVCPTLLTLLNDDSRAVRKQAVQALGQLHDARAVPALEALAASRADRDLAALARLALGSLARH